jgi:tocopherol O-methyltransferase
MKQPLAHENSPMGDLILHESKFTRSTLFERSPHRNFGERQRSVQQTSGSLSLDEVSTYYGGKTEHILRRYGPGPRVHYHTGLVDELESLEVPADVLRRRLVIAQERILKHAAQVWHAASNLSGEVIDVGCGLGGGSIFWAQEFGANVTAVTCVPTHAKLVEQFAARAGVRSKIRPLVCDVLDLQGAYCFDAAVAVDASCHLARREWFGRLFALLRPGGKVFISDCFLGRQEYEASFNRYFHARIGTINEYLDAAREAGLQPVIIEDLSNRVEHFFSITRALIQIEAQEAETGSNTAEIARCAASLSEHTILREGLRDQGYIYALMSFSKE